MCSADGVGFSSVHRFAVHCPQSAVHSTPSAMCTVQCSVHSHQHPSFSFGFNGQDGH